MVKVFFKSAMLSEGWADNVAIEWDEAGIITSIQTETQELTKGVCVPGMTNLHSHAFQRAMAGLAEVAGPLDDSFWTWRNVMYGFLAQLGPADVEAIAAQLYVELLKSGYTEVAEFHYLHHQTDGHAYDNPAEMSERVTAAADLSGIALCHLPVFYAHSGFGGQAPEREQRRFINSVDDFLKLSERLKRKSGVAFHSLRAVTAAEMEAILAASPKDCPVHIHIAEQQKEVDDCLRWSGRRPVEWLLENFAVDERWCLVHATHMSDAEARQLARTDAIAGLCPTTEANLGDGIFNIDPFLEAGGTYGIGSDSHISTSLSDELRTLEYGYRLTRQGRNFLAGGAGTSTGANLFKQALSGSAQATGRKAGIALGSSADIIVLDPDHPSLAGRQGDQILNAWIFFNGGNPVRDVYVRGRQVIQDGHHRDEEAIAKTFRNKLAKLLG